MNKSEIVNKVLSTVKNVTKHGQLTEKVLMELKMMTSLYGYIEVVTNYYSEEGRPDFNNWVDVEGMGYGWAWMKYEEYEENEEKWHEMMYEMMCKMVANESEWLLQDMDDTYYLVYENEGEKKYHFINFNGYRSDIIITLSNEELFY